MEYVTVKNLEKYHPGYKDRTLQWAKIYFKIVSGDPDCEMIENEIDWARLIKFILLELQAQQPIPINEKYLEKKGFDLKKRPISLTLKMLHNFILVVTEDQKDCHVYKEDKEKDKEEDKELKRKSVIVISKMNILLKQSYRTNTQTTLTLIERILRDYSIYDIFKVIRFKRDEWKHTEMEKYLRPQTLFGTKFESYYQQSLKTNSEPF